MQVEVGKGVTLEVEELGEADAPPLLLIMGLGAQLAHWPTAFCEQLAGRGYRVIRFDNRDVGLSTGFTQLGRPNLKRIMARAALRMRVQSPYTLTHMADDALRLLDALQLERAHVFGCSMGGMIAQTLAIRAPGRVASLVSLMSSPKGLNLSRPSTLKVMLGPAPRNRAEGVARSLEVFEALRGPRFPFDVDLHREVAGQIYDRAPPIPGGPARQIAAILASGSRAKALRALRVPTLVIHGTADPLIPCSAGRATARLIPDARLHLIEGLGHHLPSGVWDELSEQIAQHLERHPLSVSGPAQAPAPIPAA